MTQAQPPAQQPTNARPVSWLSRFLSACWRLFCAPFRGLARLGRAAVKFAEGKAANGEANPQSPTTPTTPATASSPARTGAAAASTRIEARPATPSPPPPRAKPRTEPRVEPRAEPRPQQAPVARTVEPARPAKPPSPPLKRSGWKSHGVKPMRRPTSFSSEVMVKGGVPKVLLSETAYDKIVALEDRAPDEVGWFGTVDQLDDGNFLIHDIFVLDQDVTGTVTLITNADLAKLSLRILSMPNGTDIWNRLQYWGHSHDDMGVAPSGQDDRQMDILAKCGHSWFIRSICNSKGDMKIDLYFFNEEKVWIVFPNIEWEVVQEVDPDIRDQIGREFEANVRPRGGWTSFRATPTPLAEPERHLSASASSALTNGPSLADTSASAVASSTTPNAPPPIPVPQEPAGDGAPGDVLGAGVPPPTRPTEPINP